ncbi:hypothetical protein MSAN_01346900 [Mycena sanguinolenta]|uniref:Uncharacterized protein n=1 Tax=Mycena sanguinolenta TaxID=230812 RepID=A0A8H7D3D4_9AGAR|nr:hypothetical protein MSAN_01346900 [Mycena sanguinolenta]
MLRVHVTLLLVDTDKDRCGRRRDRDHDKPRRQAEVFAIGSRLQAPPPLLLWSVPVLPRQSRKLKTRTATAITKIKPHGSASVAPVGSSAGLAAPASSTPSTPTGNVPPRNPRSLEERLLTPPPRAHHAYSLPLNPSTARYDDRAATVIPPRTVSPMTWVFSE